MLLCIINLIIMTVLPVQFNSFCCIFLVCATSVLEMRGLSGGLRVPRCWAVWLSRVDLGVWMGSGWLV